MQEGLVTDVSDMKHRFNERLDELCSSKAQNTQILTKPQYLELIEKVKTSRSKVVNKKPEDYQRLRRFDVMTIGEKEKLIVPVEEGKEQIRFYVHREEIFQLLHDAHIAIGHCGRNRMEKELNSKYKNITREMIVTYLNLCMTCEKKSVTKKGLVVRPILSKNMNSRCQVDLIDMQSQADDEYKFILVYQDHLTKFIQLRPLKSKRAEEVAYALLDIFTIFGAPSILQSDNGREFANSTISELCSMWPELKMVHGKPRHSQSQGSVERANQDVENMLYSWLEDNSTRKWSEGLRFVQLMKNRAHHSGINCTPYEAMFGTKLKVGLKSFLPTDVLHNINCEEDLEVLVKDQNNLQSVEEGPLQNKPESHVLAELPGPSQHDEEELLSLDSYVQTSTLLAKPSPDLHNKEFQESFGHEDSPEEPYVKKRKADILKIRQISASNLKKQAEKMVQTSNSKYPDAKKGDTVRVRVPDVDRGRTDGRNILAFVLEVTDANLYKLGTKHGILNQLYARNQFTICNENFIYGEDIPQTEISLRECARLSSKTGGQGYSRCGCKGGCKSDKCKCCKEKKLCNSKCHQSGSCSNK